jgi:putative Holliday junction resolvase
MDGTAGPMAGEAARFAARLHKELGLPVELVDERLSSWEAAQTLRQTKSRGRRPAKADDVAAAIILREYLNRL